MHKHPRGSKRKVIALRFFIYGFMTLSTIVISAICILLVLGYQFNFSKRTITQGGLMQFDSSPNGATIGLDGKTLPFKTPNKINVAKGEHAVTMTRQGYRPWSKTVDVDAGQLMWLNYTRFVPESITTADVKQFSSMSGFLGSPDRKLIALLPSSTKASLVLVNIENSAKPKLTTLDLPTGSYTAPKTNTNNFSLAEWDFGARYILVKHQYDKSTEYLRVDTDNMKNTVNLTKKFGLNINQLHFSGTSGAVFYGLVDGTIRQLNLGASTVSAPLASKVVSFAMYGESDMSYVIHDKSRFTVGVIQDSTARIIANFSDNQPVYSSITKYFSHYYVGVVQGKNVTVYRDPLSNIDAPINKYGQFVSEVPAKWLDFSNNGRFLTSGNDDKFTTYDFDIKKTSHGSLAGASVKSESLLWLDDYHFVSVNDDSLRMSEFDGANQEFITDVAPGFGSLLSDDGKYIFSITKKGSSYSLQSSQMVVTK